MLEDFLGVLLMLAVAAVLAVLLHALPRRFGPRAPAAEVPEPGAISARQRYATKFLWVALFFALLELGVLLLVPWAVLFRELGSDGVIIVVVFALPVAVGVHYQWRKGVLEW